MEFLTIAGGLSLALPLTRSIGILTSSNQHWSPSRCQPGTDAGISADHDLQVAKLPVTARGPAMPYQPPLPHLPAAPARCQPADQVQESRPRAVPRLLSQCRLPAGPRVERGTWVRERSPACRLVSSSSAGSSPTAAPPPWLAVSRGEGSASASDPAPPLAPPASPALRHFQPR